MKINSEPTRGTKDYLPNEMKLRDYVQRVILNTYENSGFKKIGTPILENIDRLMGSEGGENLSLIYKVLKRGKKLDLNKQNLCENDLVDCGLRYDLTMPLSRFYSNNRANLRLPLKVIQIDKVFRAERPQKGRMREFYQCDIDIIGDESLNAEIELICTTGEALLNLNFKNFTIKINDRRLLTDLILKAGFSEEDVPTVCISFDKKDKIGTDGVIKELREKNFDEDKINLFFSLIDQLTNCGEEVTNKVFESNDILKNLFEVINAVKEISKDMFKIEFDISLVRGMGYYTGMVFEIVSPEFTSSIGGGGRYDKMIGKFTGDNIPAVGFSIGFERIISILQEQKYQIKKDKKDLIILYSKEENFINVMETAKKCREKGYNVELTYQSKKLRKQINFYKENGYDAFMIFGESPVIKEYEE